MNSPTCFSDISPSLGRQNTLLHEMHQHMGQGPDCFGTNTSVLHVCMHIDKTTVKTGTSMNFI